ncbi:ATP synthase F1 subunit gamma [Fusobacterium animalis]|uniref:ATP synthase gamma chain n=1 Tax=Fusobacterium animalis TaxID=76859 RepID=A0A2G9FK71_9FUSO|nr:ATP synthase F1 subunit gamma [Fusobacterium animalis]PIM93448.1 ATP synthase F1 subunit gamma [Fusobacterium animalis]PIM93558.1 ATP synthase F1 subunit gamma [Fusobacterium animalis]
MPGMKEIKSRIKSVQSTRQITNAMEIVSTTKFKKYSKLVSESRPYEESMRNILAHIATGVKYEKHPLFDGRKEVKSIAILVMTSDRGLCGSFNSSTLKELEKLVKKLKNKNITIIPFGRKAIDFISKKKYNFSESFSKISPEEMNGIAGDISVEIVDKYNNHIYDEVYVIYNKFISALRYDLTCERIIPIERMEAEINSEYIFEPNTEYILSALLPRFINLEVYQAILNNAASEHSARKNSMGSATDNADEMIKTLNIKYNRNRQSAITQEITEIVGGASAL